VPLDPAGVAPAALEVSGLVDVVVIGAGEVEIIGKCVLDGLAVVRHVGGEDGADDLLLVVIWHFARSRYFAGS